MEEIKVPEPVDAVHELTALLDEQTGRSVSQYFKVIYYPKASRKERRDSKHPTVKPLGLMR